MIATLFITHSWHAFVHFILTLLYEEPYNTKILRWSPEIEAINYKWWMDFQWKCNMRKNTFLKASRVHGIFPNPNNVMGFSMAIIIVGYMRWIRSGNVYQSASKIASLSSSKPAETFWPKSQNMNICTKDQNIKITGFTISRICPVLCS